MKGRRSSARFNHPKADELSQWIFQRKLLNYEFIEKRLIIYLDESGFAVDAPQEKGYSRKGRKMLWMQGFWIVG